MWFAAETGVKVARFAPRRMIAAVTLSLAFVTQAGAVDDLTILFRQRPPYATINPNASSPTGLTASVVARAAGLAGINLSWQELPEERQLAMIKANVAPLCGLGWFYREAREKAGRYSAPIHQDGATTVLMLRHNPVLGSPFTLSALLQRQDQIMIAKPGFSYGPLVDRQIHDFNTPQYVTTSVSEDLVEMLMAEHGGYMLAAREEAEYLKDSSPFRDELAVVTPPDSPPGERRYLLCSKSVDPQLLTRLNSFLPDFSAR